MESMENVLVCNCKKVTYADIENALHQLPTMTAVEQQVEGVQKITHCSTGCGGCHDKIMKIISDIMYP